MNDRTSARIASAFGRRSTASRRDAPRHRARPRARTRQPRDVPEQRAGRDRAPQVHVGVVLPGEPDAAEHLHAVLRGLEAGVDGERRRGRRGERTRSRRRARPRAASHTAARASSVRAAMLAHRCFTPWNCPIGRPNWRRSVAYSAAVSTHHCDAPTAPRREQQRGQVAHGVRDRATWSKRDRGTVGLHDHLCDPSREVDARELARLELAREQHDPTVHRCRRRAAR